MGVHLVELVNAADSVVGQHQSSGFDNKLRTFLILDNCRGQTSGCTGLAGRVYGTGAEVGNLKEQIRLAPQISNYYYKSML